MTFEQLRVAAAKANIDFLAVDVEIREMNKTLERLNTRWNEAAKKRDGAERAVLEHIRGSVHTDECWEPNSGCDMGRNEEHTRKS